LDQQLNDWEFIKLTCDITKDDETRSEVPTPMGLFVMLVEKIEELEEKLKTHKFDCRFADLRCDLRHVELNDQEQAVVEEEEL
jgi:hypothetical protein